MSEFHVGGYPTMSIDGIVAVKEELEALKNGN